MSGPILVRTGATALLVGGGLLLVAGCGGCGKASQSHPYAAWGGMSKQEWLKQYQQRKEKERQAKAQIKAAQEAEADALLASRQYRQVQRKLQDIPPHLRSRKMEKQLAQAAEANETIDTLGRDLRALAGSPFSMELVRLVGRLLGHVPPALRTGPLKDLRSRAEELRRIARVLAQSPAATPALAALAARFSRMAPEDPRGPAWQAELARRLQNLSAAKPPALVRLCAEAVPGAESVPVAWLAGWPRLTIAPDIQGNLLGDAASGDPTEAILTTTLARDPTTIAPAFAASDDRESATYLEAGQRLTEALNDGPWTFNTTNNTIDFMGPNVRLLPLVTCEASLGNCPPASGTDPHTAGYTGGRFRDTRECYAVHGAGKQLTCNILMADGSVHEFADLNGDRYLNPGFLVPTGLTDEQYSHIGYRDSTVELHPAEIFSGIFLKSDVAKVADFEYALVSPVW